MLNFKLLKIKAISLCCLFLIGCGVSYEDQLFGYCGSLLNYVFNAVILNQPVKNYQRPQGSYPRRYCSRDEINRLIQNNLKNDSNKIDEILYNCHISDLYYSDNFIFKKFIGYKVDLYNSDLCHSLANNYNTLIQALKSYSADDLLAHEKAIDIFNQRLFISYSGISLIKRSNLIRAECRNETVYITVEP